MASFKDHKVTAAELLGAIPEVLMSHPSEHTGVDRYTKVFHGKKMFYLLLYGILENDRLSQRTLEDTFNDSIFKVLFGLDKDERIHRSSLSERLGKIALDYFRQIYECVYEQFSSCYSESESSKYDIVRVDSTLIGDLSGRMVEGFHQNQHLGKSVKYSVAFGGSLPCISLLFSTPEHGGEEIALPEVVHFHLMMDSEHKNIYVLQDGLQSTRSMRDLSGEHIMFVVCSKENRRYVELELLIRSDTDMDLGSLTLKADSKVYLYTGTPVHGKRGKNFYREELVEEPFRLIVGVSKDDASKEFWFITNELEMTPREIADVYRRRWDIEVFFRFLK